MHRLDVEYFARRAVKNSETGCLEWIKALNAEGYGHLTFMRKNEKAHRLAWMCEHGLDSIPDGMIVCHKCDNRKCVNVDHLFLGTKQDNYDDMARKGRDRKANGSTGHWLAKFSDEDVRRIREAYLFGARQVDLAEVWNTNQTNISRIVRRDGWRHVA